MTDRSRPATPDELLALRAEHPKLRERDFCSQYGVSEAQLVAAQCGRNAWRVPAHPDELIPRLEGLGEVMALTRNDACVHEKDGVYDNYRPGDHAAMVLSEHIDLRIFPSKWCHAFMLEKPLDDGVRRSIQVFDEAGDAVHKVFLRDGTKLAAWEALRKHQLEAPTGLLETVERVMPEPARGDVAKRDRLLEQWAGLTDTHQFLTLISRLKMNRLGAYRMAGEPFARALSESSLDELLQKLSASTLPVMIFVGNRGCIQIHSGPVHQLKRMGPWQNVLDPGFNLHLRLDQIAEVWAVEKPTRRGPALSVEAFDEAGQLIVQVFGTGEEDSAERKAWHQAVGELPTAEPSLAENTELREA